MSGYLPPIVLAIVSALLIAGRSRWTAGADATRARRIDVAVGLVIVALAAVMLLAMGRVPWCTCGVIRLWWGQVVSNENSQQLTDPYTFTHLTHGILLYWIARVVAPRAPLRTRSLLALAAESVWEVLENTDMVIERYRAATISLDYYGDSVLNVLGDVGACMLAFALAARLPIKVTIAVVVVLEAALALWIRDGLMLNVLMLIYPIEAVRRWQDGA